MTLCPMAIAAGCKRCPAFPACPLETVTGDMPQPDAPKAAESTRT